MRIFTIITRLCIILALLLLVACERNVMRRSKYEPGRGRLTLSEEMAEFEDYDKNHDKLARARHFDDVRIERKERRRNRATKDAMKDGTLLEKYSGIGKSLNSGSDDE